jgi:hypothetical protein
LNPDQSRFPHGLQILREMVAYIYSDELQKDVIIVLLLPNKNDNTAIVTSVKDNLIEWK